MSTIIEWGGLQKVEYLNVSNVIAFNDDVPNSLTVTRLTIEGGFDWVNIPFIPETASYTLNYSRAFVGRTLSHVVRLELDGDLEDQSQITSILENGWYIVRITTNRGDKYIVGLKNIPGKYSIGPQTTGTSQLNNIESGLIFTANTNKRILKQL